MKKGSFFKIASLSMLTLLSTITSLSAVAEEYTPDKTSAEVQYDLSTGTEYSAEAEAAVEEAVVEEATDSASTDDAATEEVPVCFDENGMEAPCE